MLSVAMTEIVATSSSSMVTVAELAVESIVTCGSLETIPPSVTTTVSSSSSRALSMTVTSTVVEVCPARIMAVVGSETKSSPAVAVPVTIRLTTVSRSAVWLSETVN